MISLPTQSDSFHSENNNLFFVGIPFEKLLLKIVLCAIINLPDNCEKMQFDGST
jgi:hypothetical protein